MRYKWSLAFSSLEAVSFRLSGSVRAEMFSVYADPTRPSATYRAGSKPVRSVAAALAHIRPSTCSQRAVGELPHARRPIGTSRLEAQATGAPAAPPGSGIPLALSVGHTSFVNDSAMADALHVLAAAVTTPADAVPTLRGVLSRLVFLGATIETGERRVIVRFAEGHRQVQVVFSVESESDEPHQLATSLLAILSAPGVESGAGQETTTSPMSLEDLTDALNDGSLTREIDEAVMWDPELAV